MEFRHKYTDRKPSTVPLGSLICSSQLATCTPPDFILSLISSLPRGSVQGLHVGGTEHSTWTRAHSCVCVSLCFRCSFSS